MDAPMFTGRNGAAWFVSLLGGVKVRGPWRMPRDMVVDTPVGGANLDLGEVELPAGVTPILTKVSLVGGVSLQVPPEVEVRVEGFRLFGRVRIEPGASNSGIVLRVREYSLVGGVHVVRTR
ncbi:LiaF domain-containing protein [Actinoplanes sp. NPDC051411]|uniref:LiaF domain-containing protein n=1 Tax=Actinoplanes sp. NPDC051411 TaxID=3155522 RepID=UPI0034388EE8